jgi:Homeodomain-like domain
MSRRSPFVIELTKEEQAELGARSREYTSPYREVMRAKIVLLASQGLGNDRIATRLGMPRQIVSRWRQRFYYERPRRAAARRATSPLFPRCCGRDQGACL